MERGLPPALRWGWRILRAVHPDELHGDVTASDAALRKLRAAARPFPDVPVVVLSAASSFPLPRRFRAHWTRLQAGLAAAAQQGRHVIVDGTGHNIPTHRPDVVADAILAVAAEARAHRVLAGLPPPEKTEGHAGRI
jgi:pimeloyl-ACP methyl ester carboxylesterase